jgi:hypothetical protein
MAFFFDQFLNFGEAVRRLFGLAGWQEEFWRELEEGGGGGRKKGSSRGGVAVNQLKESGQQFSVLRQGKTPGFTCFQCRYHLTELLNEVLVALGLCPALGGAFSVLRSAVFRSLWLLARATGVRRI